MLITIRTDETATDPERVAWLRHSEDVLTKIWDSPEEDVFDELLSK